MKEKAYYENVNIKNEKLLRNLIGKMPDYCKQFFIGIEPTTSSRTRIAYAYDLNCFFEYLHENIMFISYLIMTSKNISNNLQRFSIKYFFSLSFNFLYNIWYK